MEIVNIISVVKLQNPLDLEVLIEKLENTEFNKGKTWLKLRLQPDNNYIAFYGSGKFLVTGLKSMEKVEDVVNKVSYLLESSGIENLIEKIDITNIVLTDKIDLECTLEDLIFHLDARKSSYEPESFPGLFYKDDSGISFTVFNSGKIILTGVKDLRLAEEVFEKFKGMIKDF
jgi:transcription initiation factor TFIID TATA-box-binding protein